MGNMYADRELVDKILRGNKQMFTLLVKQYERLVYFIVFRIIGEEERSKDVCQEAFVKVFLKLEDFNFKSKLSTWIATIAYREALNQLKKNKYRLLEDELKVENEKFHLFEEGSAQEQLEKMELKEQVHFLIGKLPHQYKTVLTLYHLNEFNYKEIYDITGWPEGTVKNYLFRARKLLKDALKKKVRNFDVTMI